ncbi:hypothetical protein AX17_001324 [Amanita inopinata Kibby_2008]|nr:hypothetical protein AX17_001324 [Amanita inopinata Kibby_2008]
MGKGPNKKPKQPTKQPEKPKDIKKAEEAPQEADTGITVNDSAHGNHQTPEFAADSWRLNVDPPGGNWSLSRAPSQAASPVLAGDKSLPALGAHGVNSRHLSWSQEPDSASWDQQHKRYPPSPHPGLAGNSGSDPLSFDYERGGVIPRSNLTSDLDYVSEERSGTGRNSNIGQEWDATAQQQPSPLPRGRTPLPTQQQQFAAPTFPISATTFSNPPIAPDPLPVAPNVISRASEAAARLDRGKKVDLTPQQSAPQQIAPLPPAAWHTWIKPSTYAPKVEASEPGPLPQPQPPPAAPHSGHTGYGSMPKGFPAMNSSHGVWGLGKGNRQISNAWTEQQKAAGHPVQGNWSHHQSSADDWAIPQAKSGYGAWNDGAWGQASNAGEWYGNEGNARREHGGHGRSKSAAAWGGKRNVQWEEDEEETSDSEDDGWGEEATEEGWEHADGRGQSGGGNWGQQSWNQTGSAWGSDWNGMPGARPSSNRQSWSEDARRGIKVTIAPPSPVGTRTVLSPRQRSQILNSLLNATDQRQSGQAIQPEKQQRLRKQGSRRVKQADKENRRQTHYNAGWGLEDESWGNLRGKGGESMEDKTRSSSNWDAWHGSRDVSHYSMPSLTLAHAYKEAKTRLDPGGSRNKLDDITRIHFRESKGASLLPVHNALFGQTRLARDRIHWSFPPDKDERVVDALSWIQMMSYGLGTLGLHKFLQHRERGALIMNADYRPPDDPTEFALDWLTFDDLQKSMDKTLQVSVTSYDPTAQVIIFVFLSSKSGNSVAIWRRKLVVPNNARLRFQNELSIVMAGLKDPKDYVVHVDELPKDKKSLPNLPKVKGQPKPKKHKWWQFFKSKS